MTTGQPGRVGAVVGALALAVIAGGCGGGTSKTSNAGGPAASAAPAAAQTSPVASADGSGSDASACHLLTAAASPPR